MKFSEYLNEQTGDKEAYQKFFDKTLKKYGVSSPDELSAEDKKKFFDEVDKGWKSDKEEMSEASQLPREIKIGNKIDLPVSGNIKMATAYFTNMFVKTSIRGGYQTFVEYELEYTEDVDGEKSKRTSKKVKEKQSLDAFIQSYF